MTSMSDRAWRGPLPSTSGEPGQLKGLAILGHADLALTHPTPRVKIQTPLTPVLYCAPGGCLSS